MKTTDLLIALVLDKSGSMWPSQSAVISAINEFLDDQTRQTKLLESRTLVSMVQFNTLATVVYAPRNILEVPRLTAETYSPTGGTALYDGVAKAILDIDSLAERPHKVLVVIQTDGEENASREWSEKTLMPLIKAKQEGGWGFLFMGADHASWAQAAKMGIHAGSTITYTATNDWHSRGYTGVAMAASASATNFRVGTYANTNLSTSFTHSGGPPSPNDNTVRPTGVTIAPTDPGSAPLIDPVPSGS